MATVPFAESADKLIRQIERFLKRQEHGESLAWELLEDLLARELLLAYKVALREADNNRQAAQEIVVEAVARAVSNAQAGGAVEEGLLVRLVRKVAAQGRDKERSSFDEDVRFYKKHFAEFLAKYKGHYIALLNKEVVDSDVDFTELARRVYGKFGYRELFMPKVEEPKVLRLPSPRLARR